MIPAAALGAGLLRPGVSRAASQFAVGDRVVVDTDYLNLRAGAGTNQDVLDVLAYGTEATVTASPTTASADGYDWVEIQTDAGEGGWVADDYLAAASGGPGGGGLFAVGDQLMVNTDYLNLRSGQGTDSDVVDVLPYGTMVMITGLPATGSNDGYDWYQVGVHAGESGWVAGEFLAYPSNGDSGGGFGIRQFVQVNTDVLNLRDAPSLNSNVVGSAVYGDIGVVVSDPRPADGYTWYSVDFSGDGTGDWVAGEFLTPKGSNPSEPTGSTMIVNTDALNLRDGSGLNANVIAVLPSGTKVVIADASFASVDGYSWAMVNTAHGQGWVARDFLISA